MAEAGPRQVGARSWGLAIAGLVIIVVGCLIAALTQTSGGVKITDVRFPGAKGVTMSGLLYTPGNATAAMPAPAVLAVHGYINTRETQDAFAIELARRGYVVLAMDQRGHGYSGGAAMTEGFGGPDGLAYLRTLPQVDKDKIGLEGHSMGGWTVLAAAKAMPDAYKSLVLEGSSTGAPYAAEGSTSWPRNLAVVFSKYDEFGPLMWGIPKSAAAPTSVKMKTLFGTTEAIVPGKIYGDLPAGTARALYTPNTTHPGDHISTEAVGYALDWFGRTLGAPHARATSDQIWIWKEVGTLIGFTGFVVFLLGMIQGLLSLSLFAPLRGAPPAITAPLGGLRWWGLLLVGAFLPPLSFIFLPMIGNTFVPLSAVYPQAITNQLMAWAVANAFVALVVGAALGGKPASAPRSIGLSLLIGLIAVAAGYVVVALAGRLAMVDFRFWVVALKPLSPAQALAALAYLIPFAVFLTVSFRGVTALIAKHSSAARQYITAIAALAIGFAVVVGVAYAGLFINGGLPGWASALNAIIAIQFVPLLAVLAVLLVFTWRRTGSYLPATAAASLFVTWYMVAGTATHFAG